MMDWGQTTSDSDIYTSVYPLELKVSWNIKSPNRVVSAEVGESRARSFVGAGALQQCMPSLCLWLIVSHVRGMLTGLGQEAGSTQQS